MTEVLSDVRTSGWDVQLTDPGMRNLVTFTLHFYYVGDVCVDFLILFGMSLYSLSVFRSVSITFSDRNSDMYPYESTYKVAFEDPFLGRNLWGE